METNEGESLRKYLRDEKITQEDFANKLSLTRQGLGVHLRKEKLSHSFKLQLKEQGIMIFDERKETYTNANSTIAPKETGTPVYDIHATASQIEYSSQLPEVPSFTVNIPGYEDCNFGLYHYGHSMYPTIETGSLLMCRKVNDKHIIMYGEIYLIRTSDNFEKRSEDFKRFEPFELPIDKIIDLYLVKGIIKKTQS